METETKTEKNSRTASGVVLLVETTQGGHVAVRFPTAAAARRWEDKHGVETIGCVPYVWDAEALRQAGVR